MQLDKEEKPKPFKKAKEMVEAKDSIGDQLERGKRDLAEGKNELDGSVFFPDQATPKVAGLHANQQTGKPASMQTGLPASPQTNIPVNPQVRKPAKFSSYLNEESIKALKRLAFETDRKDYEVLQEAVDEYLRRTRKPANR